MQTDNPIRIVRELKGAPLSILIALTMVHQRVTQEWLERSTGYTDKPVSQALAYMQEHGLVDHTSAGWMLTGQARQLPLPLALLPEEGGAEEKPDTDDPSRNNSDSLNNIITITDSLNQQKEESNSNNTPPSRNFSDSDGSPPDYEATIQELKAAGVVGPRLVKLARLPHVSPAYVRAWDAQLRWEKGDEYKPGLLIHVIESGSPAPPTRENGHILKCHCEDCQRLRIIESNRKYDWIDEEEQS